MSTDSVGDGSCCCVVEQCAQLGEGTTPHALHTVSGHLLTSVGYVETAVSQEQPGAAALGMKGRGAGRCARRSTHGSVSRRPGSSASDSAGDLCGRLCRHGEHELASDSQVCQSH